MHAVPVASTKCCESKILLEASVKVDIHSDHIGAVLIEENTHGPQVNMTVASLAAGTFA